MNIFDLTYIINILEFTAAFLATVHFSKYKNSQERYFIYFLWFTVFVEVLGVYLRIIDTSNYWVYNWFMIVSFLFYLYWYHAILLKRALKQIIIAFSVVFIGVAFLSMYYESWLAYHKYTFVTGALFTLICTIFHFWQLLYSDEVLIIKHKLSFWISTGLLLFNMGMIPFMLLSTSFTFVGNSYYVATIVTLNVLLYGCYIIGFLWTKEKYNRF